MKHMQRLEKTQKPKACALAGKVVDDSLEGIVEVRKQYLFSSHVLYISSL